MAKCHGSRREAEGGVRLSSPGHWGAPAKGIAGDGHDRWGLCLSEGPGKEGCLEAGQGLRAGHAAGKVGEEVSFCLPVLSPPGWPRRGKDWEGEGGRLTGGGAPVPSARLLGGPHRDPGRGASHALCRPGRVGAVMPAGRGGALPGRPPGLLPPLVGQASAVRSPGAWQWLWAEHVTPARHTGKLSLGRGAVAFPMNQGAASATPRPGICISMPHSRRLGTRSRSCLD